jgi:hypothetical protein
VLKRWVFLPHQLHQHHSIQSLNLHQHQLPISKQTSHKSASDQHSQQHYSPSSNQDLERPTTADMSNVLDEFAALSLNEPYGCTYLCDETFSNKIEWRQHEHRNHRQSELWRCNVVIDQQDTQCGTSLFSAESFATHLTTAHNVDQDDIAAWVENGHIYPNGQVNFWCGFCRRIIALENQGTAAWGERLDHVEAHFENGDSIEKGWLKLRR